MKITDITPYVVLPNSAFHERVQRYWTFVRIDTDEGIYGWGEATSTNGGVSFPGPHPPLDAPGEYV